MTTKVYSVSGPGMRGPTSTDANFTLASIARDVVTSGSSVGSSTTLDRTSTTYTSATVQHQFDLALNELVVNSLAGVQYTSLNTGVATISSSGAITRISDGVTGILVSTPWLTKRIDLTLSTEGGLTSVVGNSWATGSLAKYASDAVDTRIAGKTPLVALPLFNGNLWNAGCWVADVDLTSIALGRGTLISPRHILMATHYAIYSGTITFKQPDGTNITRTLTSTTGSAGGDLTVGVLDSDVPAGISFARIMPSGWASKLPNVRVGIPVIALNQFQKAYVMDLYNLSLLDPTTLGHLVSMTQPSDTTRKSFYSNLIAGDSGHPVFMIINGLAVLLNVWHYGGLGGSGDDLSYYISGLNSAMASLGGGYTVTTADLSSFTNF